MQRMTVFISEETKYRINQAAKAKKKVESEVVREALDTGLDTIYPKTSSTQALLNLAKQAEKLPDEPGTPTDVSQNLDYYTWGGPKKHGS